MRRHSLFKAAVIVTCLFGLVACKSKSSTTGTAGSPKTQSQVLAEANGVSITADDFKKELETLPPYLKPMAQTPEGKKELLDTMVVRELILQKAAKDGIDKSQEVADKLAELKKRVVIEAYLRKQVEEKVNIPDAELKKFYDENKEKFRTGDQVRASHILVKTEKEAQDILAQLKAGAKFEDLAAKYSIDSSAAKGGDLGWFGKGMMVKPFEDAVVAMKPGQVSDPVQTQFGWHIIKLEETRPAKKPALADVKDELAKQIQQEAVGAKIKELTDAAKIERTDTGIDPAVLKNETLLGN